MRNAKWLSMMLLFCSAATPVLPHQTTAKSKTTKVEEKPALAREVQHQIQVLPFYSVFDYINFTVEGSKVTLAGQVVRPGLREQAEADIKSIEGVETVVNHIEILPTSASDDDLRDSVYRAVYEDKALERYAVRDNPPVHIIIKNGNATLEGFVQSPADKNLAATRTKAVPNVVSVRNNLEVHPERSPSE